MRYKEKEGKRQLVDRRTEVYQKRSKTQGKAMRQRQKRKGNIKKNKKQMGKKTGKQQ